MAVKYTAEQRRQVLLDECQTEGHLLNLDYCVRQGEAKPLAIEGPDGRMPSIRCRRCSQVWLVDPTPHDTYDQAESAHNQQVKPEHRFVRATVTLPIKLPPLL